jgi:hypothetical protein
MSDSKATPKKGEEASSTVARIIIIGIVAILFSAYVADLFTR